MAGKDNEGEREDSGNEETNATRGKRRRKERTEKGNVRGKGGKKRKGRGVGTEFFQQPEVWEEARGSLPRVAACPDSVILSWGHSSVQSLRCTRPSVRPGHSPLLRAKRFTLPSEN